MVQPVLPYNSGILGEGILGYMTLGEDYTRISALISGIIPHPNVQIEQYTAAFVLCGIVDNYEQFEYTANWYDLDTWTITINRYKCNVTQFVTNGFIRFYADNSEHIGLIEKIEKPLGKEGKGDETWVISGRGIEAIFAQRVCETKTGFVVVPTLTFTFAASTTITASANCRAVLSTGMDIYNSTNDADTYAQTISTISSDGLTITLSAAYTGTTGSGKTASAGDGTNYCGSTAVTGLTFTFAASTTVTASASCLAQINVGESIYNSTDDFHDSAQEVSAISADGLTITLSAAYAGTAGSGKACARAGVPAETALRYYVNCEAIAATDTSRNLSNVTLAIDQHRGALVNRAPRDDVLSDILYGICTASGLSFRLVHTTGFNFVFTVLEGSDVSSTVVLTPEYGNVASFDYIESLLDMKNLLYMGGTGSNAARIVQPVYTGTTAPSGWTRREKFVDASDCTTTSLLTAKGTETLATVGESVTMDIGYLESPAFTLGIQFKLGDIISAVFPDIVAMVTRITSIKWTWDTSGKSITLEIGKSSPDLISMIKLAQRLGSAAQRR